MPQLLPRGSLDLSPFDYFLYAAMTRVAHDMLVNSEVELVALICIAAAISVAHLQNVFSKMFTISIPPYCHLCIYANGHNL